MRSFARGLQLHYTASRRFVSDSWAFLLLMVSCYVLTLYIFVLVALFIFKIYLYQ